MEDSHAVHQRSLRINRFVFRARHLLHQLLSSAFPSATPNISSIIKPTSSINITISRHVILIRPKTARKRAISITDVATVNLGIISPDAAQCYDCAIAIDVLIVERAGLDAVVSERGVDYALFYARW